MSVASGSAQTRGRQQSRRRSPVAARQLGRIAGRAIRSRNRRCDLFGEGGDQGLRTGAFADVCEEVLALRIFSTSSQFDSQTRNTANNMMAMVTAAKPQLGFGGQGLGVRSDSGSASGIFSAFRNEGLE